MKTFMLLCIPFFLSACRLEEPVTPKLTTGSPTGIVALKPDTLPDKAAFKIKLVKDSTNYDETMIMFNHLSSPNFLYNEDAPYFQGFGQVSLASISADGRDLAIYCLPYSPKISIGLDVHTKTDGIFNLKLSYESKIPTGLAIWLRDTYLKDSVNVCKGPYTFDVIKADSNSFGNKRFKLVLR